MYISGNYVNLGTDHIFRYELIIMNDYNVDMNCVFDNSLPLCFFFLNTIWIGNILSITKFLLCGVTQLIEIKVQWKNVIEIHN